MIDPRIALIHATPLAMEPVADAFRRLWPQARCMNLLDDTLSQDRQRAGALDDALAARMVGLARYARGCGAHGILFTCSAFGPAIDAAAAATGLPTLKPNEAMFDEALARCAGSGGSARIGLLTSFAPAAGSLREEFAAATARRGEAMELVVACAEGAMEALRAGDTAAHDRLVLAAARALGDCTLVMLGQFSLAANRAALEQALGRPVLASPDSAVRHMRSALQSLDPQPSLSGAFP